MAVGPRLCQGVAAALVVTEVMLSLHVAAIKDKFDINPTSDYIINCDNAEYYFHVLFSDVFDNYNIFFCAYTYFCFLESLFGLMLEQ